MTNTQYTHLSEEEKKTLTSDDFETAVKLEAIARGISLPITLSQELMEKPLISFNRPADSVIFYEITTVAEYGGIDRSGIAYRTQEEARRALQGVVCVTEDRYGNKGPKIVVGEVSIRETAVSFSSPQYYQAKVEGYEQNTEAFDKVAEECRENWREIQQAEYNKKVLAEKKAQYLTLAQGNEEIARAFWRKAESDAWQE